MGADVRTIGGDEGAPRGPALDGCPRGRRPLAAHLLHICVFKHTSICCFGPLRSLQLWDKTAPHQVKHTNR